MKTSSLEMSAAPARTAAQSNPAPSPDSDEWRSAQEFEKVFTAEMLRHAGFEKSLAGNTGFGGQAFSTFLLDAYAEKFVINGGFGLAEKLYNAMRVNEK